MNFKNNHPEMKTVVETFVIEETQELIYDNDQLDKWNNYVDELGLSGQRSIVKQDKSPVPFMHLKTSMVNVFECLCPRKVSVEQYNVTPIPVEILDLIALSKREGYFNKIEIWYDEKSPDPVCVGTISDFYVYNYDGVPKELFQTTHPSKDAALKAIQAISPEFKGISTFGWETNSRLYLLGKWADVKHSFEELKQMASKRYIQQQGNDYRKKIKEAQRGLDDLEIEAFDKFN